jgi:phosphoglycolate phosphatase
MPASQTAGEPLFPGAREMIESLASHPEILGIATGSRAVGRDVVLGAHGPRHHFANRAPSKPHPGMVLQALEETGVAPEDTAIIGDSTYDMAMAKAAGALALGVS